VRRWLTSYFDKVPASSRTTAAPISVPAAFAWCECRRAPRIVHRKERGAHALIREYRAYVDESTMVDTWATVGSCAQIGKNVHLSGGVGIGGVLEPVQANPTIIEDNCFIGARSEVVEGVVVGEGSVISMGVYIGRAQRYSTGKPAKTTFGRIHGFGRRVREPASSDGKYSLYCAVIVKQVDAKTRAKTASMSCCAHLNAAIWRSCSTGSAQFLQPRVIEANMFLTPLFKLMAEKQAVRPVHLGRRAGIDQDPRHHQCRSTSRSSIRTPRARSLTKS